MSQESRSNWDFGRFIKTLTYFEIIPFWGCLQKLLTNRSKNQMISQSEEKNMAVILVAGKIETIGKIIINRLEKVDYRIKTLAKDEQQSKEIINQATGLVFIAGEQNQQELEGLLRIVKTVNNSQERPLFNFTNPSINVRELWGALDDVVMGGVSASNFQILGNVAVFSGNVSTDNNGGFASVRSRNFAPPFDLAGYEGIEIRLKGDGKRYKFITRCEGKWDGIGYCYSFDTIYNIWQTIRIPFVDLIPVFRAKTVPSSGAFDASKIYSMQLMLSKFEYDGALNPKFSPGLFALEVESIKAYGGQTQPKFILISSEEFSAQEDLVRDSGLNYTIINSHEIENEKLKIENYFSV